MSLRFGRWLVDNAAVRTLLRNFVTQEILGLLWFFIFRYVEHFVYSSSYSVSPEVILYLILEIVIERFAYFL